MGYIVHLKCPVGTGNLHLRLKVCFSLMTPLEGRKEMFYLTMHSTHFIYGVRHMVKDHSHSEIGNPLPPHGLLLLISIKGSFMEGRKEMFYLTTHSTHFIYCYMASDIW